MSLAEIAFVLLAVVAVVTAIAALLVRELVHTILWIAVFFVDLSAIYFLLEAPFLGVLQLGVYAGAVTVLLLFGIMVTRKRIFSREAATGIGPVPTVLALLTVIFLATAFGELPQGSVDDPVVRPVAPLGEPLRPERSLAPPSRSDHARGRLGGHLPGPGGTRVTSLEPTEFLALSGALLGIGLFGILTRRNFVLLLISIEIATNAAILNFVYFAAFAPSAPLGLTGQSIAVVLIGFAATEVAVGLAIVLALNRAKGTINVANATELRL